MQEANVLSYLIRVLGADEGVAAFAKVSAAGKAAMTQMNSLATASTRAAKPQYQLAQSLGSVADASHRASKAQQNYFGHIARTTVQSALINKLFLEFVDVSGQAIQQVDLMQNFPATMASMGQSTADANFAMQKLRDYVGQVGGNLGDATSYVTRFTGATQDVKSATALFVGLNNALIAGDSSLEEQRQSLVQWAQAIERGRPDAKEWRNFTQNMSFQLAQVAEAMGYINANELGEALTTGEESMAAFSTQLTKMATGTGPIAQQALARMNGMQFAFNVMKNTMVQGLAAIINAFGRANIVSFFQFLTQVIKVLTGWVVRLVEAFVWLLNIIGGLFGLPALKLQKDVEGIADGIGGGAGNADDLADGLGDAGKEAKKLNKSLAAFDKMNVLPEKESGSGKDDGAGGAGFGAGEIGALSDLLAGLDTGLQEVSKWAKIFAGILAGIAAIKFAGPILRQIKALTDGFKGGMVAAKNLGDAIKNSTGTKDGFKNGKTAGEDFKGGMATAFRGLPGIIGGILGGLTAVVGPAVAKVMGGVVAAIAGASAAVVAVVLAIVVAVIATIYVLVTYWDEIVAGMKSAWEAFTGVLAELFRGPMEELGKQWDKFYETIRPGIEKMQELFQKLKDKLEPVFKKIREALQPVIDKIKELYEKYVQPLIDKFKELTASSNGLIAVVKGIGLVIGGIVLAAIGLFLAAIAGVVIAVAALAAGIVWVIAKLFEFAAYIIGGGLWEDIQAIVAATGQWIQDRFNDAVEFVKSIFSGIGDFFKERWENVKANLAMVGTWFKEKFQEAWNNMKAIWDVLGNFFSERWENVKRNLATIGTWFKERFQEAWNNMKAIWDVLGNFFKERWENLKSNLSGVANWFRDTFQSAWNNITRIFGNLWSWFRDNVWNKITSVFSSIGTAVGDAVSKAFKGVVNTAINGISGIINTFIRTINGAIGIINKIPGVSISRITEISLPRLARGGIIDQPTTAIIGEDGREAVVPLENNMEWLDKLAAKINTSTGSGQPLQLTVQIGEEQIARKVIELINEKTNMSGRNVIYV
jgi:tape measure domain-containing protein